MEETYVQNCQCSVKMSIKKIYISDKMKCLSPLFITSRILEWARQLLILLGICEIAGGFLNALSMF